MKIISLDRAEAVARLRQIADRIRAECPEVGEVRLFGSLARRDHTGASDADVLIVLHRPTDDPPHRRVLTYLPYFDLPIGTDLLVLSRTELDDRLAGRDPFLAKAWRESISL